MTTIRIAKALAVLSLWLVTSIACSPQPPPTPIGNDLPSFVHSIGLPETEEELTAFIDAERQLCVSQKPIAYTKVALGAATLDQYVDAIQEANARSIRESSNGAITITPEESTEYVLWMFSLCDINEEDALAYKIPGGSIDQEYLNSFPLRPAQFFSGTRDLDQEVAFWHTQCVGLQEQFDLAYETDMTTAEVKDLMADTLFQRTAGAPASQRLSDQEAKTFINWWLAACELELR